jgi:hypothetical protein
VLESLVALQTAAVGAGQADPAVLDTMERLGRLRARDASRLSDADREANRQLWREIARRSQGLGPLPSDGNGGDEAMDPTTDLTRAGRALLMAAEFTPPAERAGVYDEALGLLRGGGAGPEDVAAVLVKRAGNSGEQMGVAQRRALLEEALGLLAALRGSAQYLECAKALAGVLMEQNRLMAAEPLLREALEGERRALGSGNERVVQTTLRLAGLLVMLGPLERREGRELLEEVLQGERARAGASEEAIQAAERLLREIERTREEEFVSTPGEQQYTRASLRCEAEGTGPKGLVRLSRKIRDTETFARLEEIHLSGKGLRDGVLPLLDALAEPHATPMLRVISLYNVALDTEDARAAAQILSRPESQARQQRLTVFHISECQHVGDEGVASLVRALRAYPRLTDLGISKCGLGPAGLVALVEALQEPGMFPSLDKISVTGNPLGDAGVTALMTALSQRREGPGLKGLHLGSTQMSNAGLEAIGRAIRVNPALFEPLASLDITYNETVGDASLRDFGALLPQLPGLVRIDWKGVGTGPAAMKALATAAKLPDALAQVTSIDLWGEQGVGDAGIIALAEALMVPTALPRLEILSLYDVGMTAAGAKALARALGTPGALQSLKEVNIDRNKVGEAGGAALAKALRVAGACPRLKQLSLGYEGGGAENFARAFYDPDEFEEILRRNQVEAQRGGWNYLSVKRPGLPDKHCSIHCR